MVAGVFAATLVGALLRERAAGGERDEVSAYIRQVSDTRASFAVRYGSINRAYEEFRLSPRPVAEQLPRLRAAAQMMTRLRIQVEQISAPEAATELRRQLIAYFRQHELVAYELVAVMAYLPKLLAAEKPLADANRDLRDGLERAGTTAQQAAALRRYARRLDAVAAALGVTKAPPLLAPAQQTYARQIGAYAASSRRLAAAVASGDRNAFAAANEQLAAAAARPSGALRAQRAAIEGYNKRVNRIKTLAAAVEDERQRLAQQLG